MRLGVLDIGSNSAQLLAVDARPGAPPLPVHAIKEPSLLGERIEPDGSIARDGIQQVAESVARAVLAAQRFGVDQLYPFATSAIRDATNSEEVLEHIWQLSGIRPQFLSGQQEARLTYLAVHRWYGWSAGRILMLDIGGGSMEIALGRDIKPELAVSLPLGGRQAG
jgi:exopolyphosphatase/guanosine-5'-triphosphate,3'-diphosphate pyrophosphatase